jgi:phosphohistidine phosphatase
MRLYIVRHAHAEPAGECGDFARRLTLRGKLEARMAGRALRDQPAPPGLIVTSPAHRASETAEEIAREFASPPRLEIANLLYSGAPWAALLEAIPELRASGSVALVSHLPFVEELAQSLLQESASLRFVPSAAVGIDFEGGPEPSAGRLGWVHRPPDSSAPASEHGL